MNEMKKIIVIGPSGAGKSTLAKQLAERLNVPHIELDSFYHQKYWRPRDSQEFKDVVFKLAEKPVGNQTVHREYGITPGLTC